MQLNPTNLQAYELLHKGSLALANVENNGIYIDVPYCLKQQKLIGKKIDRYTNQLDEFPEMKKWKKVFGRKFKIGSNPQLGKILYDHFGYETEIKTATGKSSTSEDALLSIKGGAPEIVEKLLLIRKLTKAKNTYLDNFIKEQVNGIMHPFFNLNRVITYRSSSSDPNFQNIPVRDPDMKKLLRRAIVPPKGFLLAEIDYSGAEVKVATCYHKDPNMIKEINDPKRDMHRDMAILCYQLDSDGWDSKSRFASKNGFVFPEFYGDYFGSCAKQMWGFMESMKLETKGVSMKKQKKKKGIKNLKQFTDHMRKVEEYFWNKKFPVYNQWKKDHLKNYEKNGYIDFLTGFRIEALLKENDVINYPVQGAAFHCLLWSLIELDDYLRKNNFKSFISGQIHDSIFMYIHPDELNEVLPIVK
ncbi:MAG: hypothetical protein GY870_03630, partial [archaeon]|nr:hypothetical protein [archaeon]